MCFIAVVYVYIAQKIPEICWQNLYSKYFSFVLFCDIMLLCTETRCKMTNIVKREEEAHMRTTGIIRGIDEVGRIVIPKEYRRMLKVNDKEDSLEISMEGDRIVLRKHMPACTFCGSADGMIEYSGYKICRNCVDNLEQIVGQQVEGE